MNSRAEQVPLIVGQPMADIPDRHAAAVLVIDDDDAVRRLYRKKLVAAGYEVIEAADGRSGFAAARACRVHAALIDVMLPEVDGWGVLAAVRDDVHLAEMKIVMMSACDHRLSELQESEVMADAWFLKGSGGSVVDVVDGVLARRFGVLSALGAGAWGPLSDVGLQSLLGGLCDARLRCELSIDDGVSSWRIKFDDGVIASAMLAHAVGDEPSLFDRAALLALLEVKDAPWSIDLIDETPVRTLGLPWRSIASGLCDAINEQRERVRCGLLSTTRSTCLDAARLIAWSRQASSVALEIARDVVDGKAPCDLIADAERSPLVVDAVLSDLVRRGVIAL
ncbi:MAG: response regulator [Deltaproteobacteria bacterium]|nr:response regulator [Deltaproteobacteria bacterium]